MTQKKWIRVWHYTGFPADDQDIPHTGDPAGVVDFDRIEGLYPSRHDPAHLNVQMKGKQPSCAPWLTVLRADVHMIEPALAATFPLASAGGGK